MPVPDAARTITLALSVAPGPLSIETLLGWNLARPAELWGLLSSAQAESAVRQVSPGHFELGEGARRDEVIASATRQEWAALLGSTERVAWVTSAARAAAAGGRFATAGAILRALVATPDRDAFPDGERGWLTAVLHALRASRAMHGIPAALLADALQIAVAQGDVGAQGVLHGALAAASLRDGQPRAARQHLDRAREAAGACAVRARAEIHMYLAIGLALQGRPREAVACFEELLGDLPDDLATLIEGESSAPATGLFVVTLAYAVSGQVPRALDLIHRVRTLGAERGARAVEPEADLFACIALLARRDLEPARALAERAHAYYAATGTDPVHLWFAAALLGYVRAREGRSGEIPALLARGLQARRASGWPWLPSTAVLDLLEHLDVAGIRIEGFALDAELDRILRGPNLLWRGAAHRYRGRRLSRRGDPRAARRHLVAAVASLEEAGGGDELARARADLAALRDDGATATAEPVTGPPPTAPGAPSAGAERAGVRRVLVELGRLGALASRREGLWGVIAARLCDALGAERCALVERGSPPRLLAVRGGTSTWRDAIVALVAGRAPEAPEALAALTVPGDDAPGRLLVVPFAAEGRGGWACLENRHARPAIGPEDGELVEVLSAQLGVLLGNVSLWQELTVTRERLEAENRYWRSTGPATAPSSAIVADSPALRQVLELVARVAPTSTAVLVTGETGVGKELIASEVHRQSPRRAGPFIAVHVASLSPGLVASGLFGHERGAFTGATEQVKGRFELADGGTLFLDEIGELSLEDQVRLLRVLQQGSFERVGGTRPLRSDFRLVAATNRDLRAEVRAGRFREDLYFRIAAFPIDVPPLRERREEIPTLALFFMERASRGRGVRFEGIGEADMRRMLEYAWPGNVRELEHVIQRAVILSEPPRLHLPPLDGVVRLAPPPAPADREWVTLAEAERRYVSDVLEWTGGRVTGAGGAAEILDVKPSTLNFRIRKLGLDEALRRARARRRSGP